MQSEPHDDSIIKIIERKKLPKPVYYIESPSDNTVLVGVDVSITDYEVDGDSYSIVKWRDTVRERIMYAAEIKQQGDFLTFRREDREGGGHYYFMPMNLEVYNSKVRQRLVNGLDFENEDDLINAFLDIKNPFS